MEYLVAGKLTEALKAHETECHRRMMAAEATCEDWQEPLFTLTADWKRAKSLVRMSEAKERALKVAVDCVKAVIELDTSRHSALGEKYRTPRQSAEFTLYELKALGFVGMNEIIEAVTARKDDKTDLRTPHNPATLKLVRTDV